MTSIEHPQAPVDVRPAHYDGVTRAFHWATVALVLINYGLAETWDFAARGSPERHFMQNTHVSLGILLSAVILGRLLWRFTKGSTPPRRAGWSDRAAQVVHAALYGLIVAEAVLGWNFRWAQNAPLSFFGLFTIPGPWGYSADARHTIAVLHNRTAQAIMILAGGHAAAALVHHYVLRDDVLGRMIPLRQRTAASTPTAPGSGGEEPSRPAG